ncbi:MAG: CBS domain-containing protein [Candidatus Hadarchaeales archaeon]
MNTKPRKVNPETPIDELIERLLSQIEGSFPVVDKKERVVGIVTESDVLQILQVPLKRAVVGPDMVQELKKRMATKVGDIMTRDPVTVSPDMNMEEVLNIMSIHKLRSLPVTERGKLVGLINLRKIIEFYRLLR